MHNRKENNTPIGCSMNTNDDTEPKINLSLSSAHGCDILELFVM
jgi:hypothetical protein